MIVPNRHDSSTAYRYGFQGQEKDDEIKGEGNSLNYTFRMHDPRVGRFFTPDPLERDYPYITPYQFSSNTPIMAVELEGLESSKDPNPKPAKKETGDCEGCKTIGLENGDFMSDVQVSTYTANFENVTKKSYENLKNKFLSDPGNINDNFFADYKLVDRDGNGTVSKNDHVDIDILGPDNASVIVNDAYANEKTFGAKFSTLKGHTDAGYIFFTALYDSDKKTLSYIISNTTRTNTHMSALGAPLLSRVAQQQQWRVVLSNVADILGFAPKSAVQRSDEYDYNDVTNEITVKESSKTTNILGSVKNLMN